MEWKRLTAAGGEAYEKAMELYRSSFPEHEQRLPASQAEIMGEAAYRFDLLYDGETWVGLMLTWETEDFIYVEHFCILPALRGRGYGQRALELLEGRGKPVILEIDPPVDEASLRRKAFYERAGYLANGFPHVHPPYRPGWKGHPLVVMSRPGLLSAAEYAAFDDYLRQVVMGFDFC